MDLDNAYIGNYHNFIIAILTENHRCIIDKIWENEPKLSF